MIQCFDSMTVHEYHLHTTFTACLLSIIQPYLRSGKILINSKIYQTVSLSNMPQNSPPRQNTPQTNNLNNRHIQTMYPYTSPDPYASGSYSYYDPRRPQIAPSTPHAPSAARPAPKRPLKGVWIAKDDGPGPAAWRTQGEPGEFSSSFLPFTHILTSYYSLPQRSQSLLAQHSVKKLEIGKD